MRDRTRHLSTRLLTALGVAAAILGLRALLRREENRSFEDAPGKGEERRASQPAAASPRQQPRDQPDRQPVPATGKEAGAPDLASAASQPAAVVDVREMVNPLVQHLLAFDELIALLRDRRQGGDFAPGSRTLSEGDRAGFEETLDRLEALVPDYGPGHFEGDSLQARIYRLTVKVREALRDRDLGDDDLFRINGEVRAETCRLLAEIQWEGADDTPEFERVREVYNCG